MGNMAGQMKENLEQWQKMIQNKELMQIRNMKKDMNQFQKHMENVTEDMEEMLKLMERVTNRLSISG
jgi:hypothetical protein